MLRSFQYPVRSAAFFCIFILPNRGRNGHVTCYKNVKFSVWALWSKQPIFFCRLSPQKTFQFIFFCKKQTVYTHFRLFDCIFCHQASALFPVLPLYPHRRSANFNNNDPLFPPFFVNMQSCRPFFVTGCGLPPPAFRRSGRIIFCTNHCANCQWNLGSNLVILCTRMLF